MDDKVRYWILLSLRESSKGITEWNLYEKMDDSLGDEDSLHRCLNELEKEKLLEYTGLYQKYTLTEKGRKEINNYIGKAGPLKMFDLQRMVPDFGVKYRLRTIEAFLGSFFMLFILGLTIVSFENYFDSHLGPAFFVSMFVILFSFFLLGTGISITLNFLVVLIRSIYNPLAKLISKNLVLFFLIIFFIAIVAGAILFVKVTGYDFKELIAQIIVLLMGILITQLGKVKRYLDKKFGKKK